MSKGLRTKLERSATALESSVLAPRYPEMLLGCAPDVTLTHTRTHTHPLYIFFHLPTALSAWNTATTSMPPPATTSLPVRSSLFFTLNGRQLPRVANLDENEAVRKKEKEGERKTQILREGRCKKSGERKETEEAEGV